MTNYRHARVPGATYFFTVNLARRDTALLVERIAALREAVRDVRRRHPFVIDAMVTCPITCTPSGRSRRTTSTSPYAGA